MKDVSGVGKEHKDVCPTCGANDALVFGAKDIAAFLGTHRETLKDRLRWDKWLRRAIRNRNGRWVMRADYFAFRSELVEYLKRSPTMAEKFEVERDDDEQ